MKLRIACAVVAFLSLPFSMAAQTSASSAGSAQVPPLIQFSSVATDEGGNNLSGAVSITFSLYGAQQGGEALWTETQKSVQLDSTGHYSVQLGITKTNGVPLTLFTTGEARWMGIRIAEQTEQPRVLLLSVPYAMKAGDAATIGGLPPSAFVLTAPGTGSAVTALIGSTIGPTAASVDVPAAGDVTGSGTVNFIPLWTTTSNIANSVLFQSGTGAAAKIGVNNAAPATTLDVKGAGTIRGVLNLPATGVATAAAGKNSEPLSLVASAFNTTAAVNQTFRWQAEPAGNDTATPSSTLNLLFAEGTSAPAETGLNIASNGQINFAPGQIFPGTGNGTVTSVAAGNGLKGGTITESGTLSVDPTMVAFLGSENQFTASQNVVGNLTATNLSASGTVTGGTVDSAVVNATSSFNLGGVPFAFGSTKSGNALFGFAGNPTMTGTGNTASGYQALGANTSGQDNVAIGLQALAANTTGGDIFFSGGNVAVGAIALQSNTTGNNNAAVGGDSGIGNTTGSFNTALGSFSAFGASSLQFATAVGSEAQVNQSNALVLGGISGVNGCNGGIGCASVSVGIGTTTPGATLDVRDNGSGGNTISAITAASAGSAVFGSSTSTTGVGNGGFFDTYSNQGTAVVGINYGTGNLDQAGYFQGNVVITGSLSKGSGSFKIDHPLDPANKFLYHSFVESPDMMNIYNGVATLDARGSVWITLPDYFEALNQDFRYQLTSMGRPQPSLYVAREISGNRFRISGGKPGGKVSWQVTGIRHDAYADAHRIQVEVEKPPQEQGRYLHPELFGARAEEAIGYPVPAGSTQGERSSLKVAAALPR